MTDWMWVYENPKKAAARIDELEAALRAVRDFPYIGGKAKGELAIIAAALKPKKD